MSEGLCTVDYYEGLDLTLDGERPQRLLCAPTWETSQPLPRSQAPRHEEPGQLRFDAPTLAGQMSLF